MIGIDRMPMCRRTVSVELTRRYRHSVQSRVKMRACRPFHMVSIGPSNSNDDESMSM